jgi:threonine dehydrogenase-like Zn-dependent dehydrogenase
VTLTASAICGTDLHMIRGTVSGMEKGTILGHEGVGIVEEIGKNVRNLSLGDRVVIPSTIGCGNCSYCRAGYYAQCNNANPTGEGTAFFGGPKESGSFHGLQAEKARIPFANVGPVKLPEEVDDDQAILLSDIVPTGYMAAVTRKSNRAIASPYLDSGQSGKFVSRRQISSMWEELSLSTLSPRGWRWPARRGRRSSTSTRRILSK